MPEEVESSSNAGAVAGATLAGGALIAVVVGSFLLFALIVGLLLFAIILVRNKKQVASAPEQDDLRRELELV